MMLSRPIVLIGMMGAGKSSLGRRLGLRLSVPFADSDDEIVRAAGISIPEIFEMEGEPGFRARERAVVREILTERPVGVLATGGGAFMNEETRQLILDRALCVWLKAPLDILLERVSRRDDRPLLRTGDPREILTRLMVEREPVYAAAPLMLEVDNRPQDETVARLIDAVMAYWEKEL